MRLKDGQISLSSSKDKQAYRKLRRLLDKSLNLSGDYWNWPTVGYLTLPTMQRILNLAWIYDLQIKSSGCIMEFGLHYGSSFAQLINLRSILEPYNYSRHIYGFDTFEGFSNTSSKDGFAKEKDFKVQDNYEEHIEKICSIHESFAPKEHIKKFTLLKGDAASTLTELLENRPDLVISLVIFDMDIYKPTKEVLAKIKPHLHKGSIIVFDEFNSPHFPGETVAAMEELDFKKVEFLQSPYLPFNTIYKF
jgi:hypothetical protein